MMRHNLKPEDLIDKQNFELMRAVSYAEMKPFILEQIQKKDKFIKFYALTQIIALVILLVSLGFFSYQSIRDKQITSHLIQMIWAGIFSFSLLIILHELFHAIAFLLLGKKDISFGAQWNKFMFYAEANRQVLNKKEMKIVAYSPLFGLSLALILAAFLSPWSIFFLTSFFIHFFFCAGDIAIIAFMESSPYREVYTFDDREKKTAYYYGKRRG